MGTRVLLLALMLTCSACVDSDLPRIGELPHRGSAENPEAGQADDALQAQLQGKWRSRCDSTLLGGVSFVRTFEFDGNSFDSTVKAHDDGACRAASEVDDYRGTYLVAASPDEFPSLDNGIEFTVSAVRVTLLTGDRVSAANEARECGIADWAVGVAREVTGTDCARTWVGAMPGFAFSLKDGVLRMPAMQDPPYDRVE